MIIEHRLKPLEEVQKEEVLTNEKLEEKIKEINEETNKVEAKKKTKNGKK